MSLYRGDELIAGLSVVDETPIGTIIPFAGNTASGNYLYCDGSAVSRTQYSELFAVIGTTYGPGDGSTTFNIPDLRDRFLQGIGTRHSVLGAKIAEELPNIKGEASLGSQTGFGGGATGAFDKKLDDVNLPYYIQKTADTNNSWLTFAASKSNNIYKDGGNVQPLTTIVKYYIKAGRNYLDIKTDDSLSKTSTNPIQNKVVKEALDKKLNESGGTMTGDITMGTNAIKFGANNLPLKAYGNSIIYNGLNIPRLVSTAYNGSSDINGNFRVTTPTGYSNYLLVGFKGQCQWSGTGWTAEATYTVMMDGYYMNCSIPNGTTLECQKNKAITGEAYWLVW